MMKNMWSKDLKVLQNKTAQHGIEYRTMPVFS